MLIRHSLPTILAFGLALTCAAQDKPESKSKPKPAELAAIKASIGVWDAAIEVWPQGLDSPSITFKGVETNRAYGEHWLASDFDSEFQGQTMKIHSIVGYDLDKKKMVGTIIDHGPYSASMTGTYDVKSKTIEWLTKAKMPNGQPMLQKTTVTQNSADKRTLVLHAAGKKPGEFNKFMEIVFVKRK